jgi:heavy metal sensor kinase
LPDSLRLTVLLWFGVLLAAALGLFGLVLHDEMERALYQGVDARIEQWVATVERALEEAPPGTLEASLFATLPEEARFTVWTADGRPLAASAGRTAGGHPVAEGITTTVEDFRSRTARSAQGSWVRVGQDIRREHDRIRGFLNLILGAGAFILVVSLAGGWLLISRALLPLAEMTRTAERISSGSHGERIDAASIQNELGGLARTLNATFDRLQAVIARQVRFTADASHELRTPLAILMSHLELLSGKDRTPEAVRERVRICLRAARRMRTVIDQLLTLARIDAGDGIEKQAANLASIVEETLASLAPLAERAGVTVTSDLAPVLVSGDPERLRQAVSNLVANALSYNRPGGSVRVVLAHEGNEAVLRVADSGIGIPEDELPRIFDRFYRVDRARTRSRGGAGIGLSITRWVVEAHGGEISVKSRVGSGTTFTVRLPDAGAPGTRAGTGRPSPGPG